MNSIDNKKETTNSGCCCNPKTETVEVKPKQPRSCCSNNEKPHKGKQTQKTEAQDDRA